MAKIRIEAQIADPGQIKKMLEQLYNKLFAIEDQLDKQPTDQLKQVYDQVNSEIQDLENYQLMYSLA